MVIVTTTTAWSGSSGYFSTAFLFAQYKKIKFLQFQVSNHVLGMYKRPTAFGLQEKLDLSCGFENSFELSSEIINTAGGFFPNLSLKNWTLRLTRLQLQQI